MPARVASAAVWMRGTSRAATASASPGDAASATDTARTLSAASRSIVCRVLHALTPPAITAVSTTVTISSTSSRRTSREPRRPRVAGGSVGGALTGRPSRHGAARASAGPVLVPSWLRRATGARALPTGPDDHAAPPFRRPGHGPEPHARARGAGRIGRPRRSGPRGCPRGGRGGRCPAQRGNAVERADAPYGRSCEPDTVGQGDTDRHGTGGDRGRNAPTPRDRSSTPDIVSCTTR